MTAVTKARAHGTPQTRQRKRDARSFMPVPDGSAERPPIAAPDGRTGASWTCYDATGERAEDAAALRRIDAHTADFDDSSFDQLACYKAGQWPGRTSHFLSLGDDQVIGGATIVLYRLPLVGSGIANVRFGPFWRRRDAEPKPERYAAIVDQLIEEYALKRRFMLTILPRPSADYGEIESDILRRRGFEIRNAPAGSPRHMVDLRLSPEDQRASLAQKWRYNLRKALDRPLTIRRDDTDEGHEAFSAAHSDMISRKRIQISDALDLLPRLRADLPSPLRPITYLAIHEGRAVCGAVVMPMGDTAYYLYGASSDEALKLRASYALHWEIVRELSDRGFQYYDLGGASGAAGLLQFKKGLAGRAGLTVPTPAEHVYAASPRASVCGGAVNRLRDAKLRLSSLRNRAATGSSK